MPTGEHRNPRIAVRPMKDILGCGFLHLPEVPYAKVVSDAIDLACPYTVGEKW